MDLTPPNGTLGIVTVVNGVLRRLPEYDRNEFASAPQTPTERLGRPGAAPRAGGREDGSDVVPTSEKVIEVSRKTSRILMSHFVFFSLRLPFCIGSKTLELCRSSAVAMTLGDREHCTLKCSALGFLSPLQRAVRALVTVRVLVPLVLESLPVAAP